MAWEHHEFLLSMMLFRHTPGDEIICHCFLCKLVRLNLCELKRACHKELSIASTATLIISSLSENNSYKHLKYHISEVVFHARHCRVPSKVPNEPSSRILLAARSSSAIFHARLFDSAARFGISAGGAARLWCSATFFCKNLAISWGF